MALLCALVVLAAAALIPFVALDLQPLPQLVGVYAATVLVADACTCVLLLAQFRLGGERWLLALASAYLYSGLMAVLHALSYPGAIVPGAPVIGTVNTTGWLFLFWNAGFVLLLFVAVVAAGHRRVRAALPGREARRLLGGLTAAVVALTLALVHADDLLPPLVIADRFSPWSAAANYVRGLLAVVALALVWSTDRKRRVVVLWLSLTLVAASVGPVLTDLAGRRYTFGWYAGRAFFVFASYALLAVLLAQFVKLQHALAATVVRLRAKTTELTAEVERRELAERKLVSAERMNAIGQLASGVAHDFNNLLTAVIANLEVILRLGGDARVRTSAEHAKQAALRGARMTGSLLAFGRQQPLRSEVVRTAALIHGSLPLLRRAAGGHIQVDVATAADTWDCEVDPVQLEVTLLNLVVNARDALPDGGRIVIATRNVDSSAPTFAAALDDTTCDYVEIAVSDNGVGIPPELQDRVFEPFFTTKDARKGTGLGLSQVQGFARQSGGDVTLDSREGHGTTVRLFLPRTLKAVARPMLVDAQPA